MRCSWCWPRRCAVGVRAAPPPGSAAGGGGGRRRPNRAGYFSVPAAQLAHLQLVQARDGPTWETTVRTTGTVDWDNDHTTQAITQVSGPITRIAVDTGTRVKAGDPLLYVASADVANAMSTYRKAKNRLDLAQTTLDRSRICWRTRPWRSGLRVGAGRLQRRVDRRADGAPGAQGLRRHAGRPRQAAEQQNAAIRPELAMRCADRRHDRAEAGAARAVHPGRRHRRVRHQQRVDGVGAGPRLRQGPAPRCTSATRSRSATRRCPRRSTASCRTSAI